ncbi:amino acid adenylation domain-containing protein [Streptomyces misionensis]|uniref:Amino acid adenylation domain-containing protein n=1 Tax=Streptomyces misionensis TaxID=67331 RepID=A0A1H5FMI7_9ACTN|nr:non-ribosomal peptide synthetase [Streptomyces misionensis]SEE04138.1 amino acid adenylation domain-containing protein [Streptomyces misionensis]
MNAVLLPKRFAEQARRTPHAVAVVDGEHTVDYRELDRAANRTARLLRGLGAGPGTLVAVALERGPDLIVALLAVWKASAAYVPLDPGQPPARLTGMVRDSGAALVLADEPLAGPVRDAGARPLSPARVRAEAARLPATPPDGTADPDDLAYAIFTSGSTGRPKAVAVTHAGIAGRVGWGVAAHRIGPGDRVLLKTSIAFDAAGWEILAPLTSGGTIVLAPPGAERDPAALLDAVARHQVTVLQAVPSVLRLLAEEDPGGRAWADCGALRLLCSAGEPLYAELAARIGELTAGRVELWNTYGPTECSIDVTAQRVDPGQTTGAVPIGRAITGMRVLVLGPAGEPVPVGVPGELYAGGPGVARGYLGRPALTAERFVPDPYGPPGARLYRTGDLVQWRDDLTLEYLGRIDHQVKVNGVRIEPGEIESALAAHPAVSGAVVTPCGREGDAAHRLAAHVTTREPVTDEALRAFLAERLPESHVPAVFRTVDGFPLTVGGKADRAALVAAEELRGDGGAPYVAPRDAGEELVAGVWAELLGRERIGAHDDFFALGGTSLHLARLAARLRAASGGRVPLRGLFAAATVEAQARLLGPAPAAAPGGAVDGEPVRPVPRDGDLPLSPGQRRLWFLDRLAPASAEWVAPVMLRLPAGTGEAAVRAALRELTARHEALRTRYPSVDGEPRQRIAAPYDARAEPELRTEDTERAALAALFGEELRRGFDLERGPLWRALLARITGEDHLLLLTVHHIGCDGWSSTVIERELGELCAAHEAGRAPELAPPQVQYADYAAWQRRRLTDEYTRSELDHWRGELAGLEALELPVDRPRPAERDARGAVVSFEIDPEVSRRLTDLGRADGATPFMTLLTAFAALLARHTGQWDVPVGTPVPGRDRPETASTVGFFLNSLVVRCRLDATAGFRQALARVRDTARSAFAHQDLPFERLVEELGPERDLSRTPLYQVAFDLHSEGATSVAARPEDAAALARAWRVAKTDLSLFVRLRPDGSFGAALEYATALFDEATVARLADRFTRLLRAVADRPEQPLAQVELIPAAQRRRQLVEWNATAAPTRPGTVLDWFEDQAARTPGADAVVLGGRTLRYGELDARAGRLARHLRALGVAAESRVGVLLDRGPELITALLAVWKAGAAYVPFDPEHPAGRIAALLDEARVTALITVRDLLVDAPATVVPVLLDEDARDVAPRPAAAPSAPGGDPGPDRLAYVVFTSGSTGRAKGVEVTHRGLANHVDWAARELASRGPGGAPLFSSVAYDLVVPTLWAPLVTGGAVTVVPPGTDLSALGRALGASAPYAFVKLTPGHLDVLADQLAPAEAAALAPVLVVAGEPFTRSIAERWRALAPDAELINEYGPTEATVGTSVHPVPGTIGTDVLPIGRPLPNVTQYVLDAELRPVPTGVTGELYIGGGGVARGYTGRPGLTAGRFLPDPFAARPGARLYRSGDLVRQRDDGTVVFVGRADDQIKLRGHRIEPGEVRAVLTGHPDVRDAVVGLHRPEGGEPFLVAHYVPAEPAPRTERLAEHCARSLPEAWVPSAFVPVPAIPLNANGKVDRRALPAPGRGAGAGSVAPSGPVQERLAAIWTELLGSEPGVHDSFFAQGGNSITGIRLVARIQEAFEIDLPVRALFETPTVAGLASAVEEIIVAEAGALSDEEIADRL